MERIAKLSAFSQLVVFILIGLVASTVLSIVLNLILSGLYPSINGLSSLAQLKGYPVQYLVGLSLPLQVGFFLLPGVVYGLFLRKTQPRTLHKTNIQTWVWSFLLFTSLLFLLPFLTAINTSILEIFNVAESSIEQKAALDGMMNYLVGDNASDTAFYSGLLIVGAVTGVSEEYFFRGLIQNHIARNTHKVWLALIVSSLFFTLLHANWAQFIPILAFGFALGIIYQVTGSLIPGMLLHITNNCLNVYWMHTNSSPDVLEVYSPTISIPAVLCLLALLFAYRKRLRFPSK